MGPERREETSPPHLFRKYLGLEVPPGVREQTSYLRGIALCLHGKEGHYNVRDRIVQLNPYLLVGREQRQFARYHEWAHAYISSKNPEQTGDRYLSRLVLDKYIGEAVGKLLFSRYGWGRRMLENSNQMVDIDKARASRDRYLMCLSVEEGMANFIGYELQKRGNYTSKQLYKVPYLLFSTDELLEKVEKDNMKKASKSMLAGDDIFERIKDGGSIRNIMEAYSWIMDVYKYMGIYLGPLYCVKLMERLVDVGLPLNEAINTIIMRDHELSVILAWDLPICEEYVCSFL